MADQNEKTTPEIDENTPSSQQDTVTTDSPALDNSQTTQESTMTSDAVNQATNQKQSNNSLVYATLLLSAGALALSGWQFYQSSLQTYDTKLDRISQSNAKLETIVAGQSQAVAQVAPIQTSLSQVIPALKKLETDGQNTQENTAKLGAEITSVRKQLSRLKNTSKEDWKLAEAEYLVRLANQRLLMEKDIDGAEQLLVSADTILAEMKDPILFDTRRALAKDIQALKSTRSFDLEGVYLQLEALVSQVNNLPQKEPSKLFTQTPVEHNEEANIEAAEMSYAKALMQDVWQTLRSLVVINYNSKPIKPLLPPTEYQQLITGIQLQVNVAQLALMKQESSVYQIALEHIANAVNEHFDIDSAAVSGYLTSLTALQQINVSPELPLPRDSLTSMKSLMENWNGKGKNNKQATQAPAETLGITPDKDITAKPQAQAVPELIKVAPSAQNVPEDEAATEAANLSETTQDERDAEIAPSADIDTQSNQASQAEQTSAPVTDDAQQQDMPEQQLEKAIEADIQETSL